MAGSNLEDNWGKHFRGRQGQFSREAGSIQKGSRVNFKEGQGQLWRKADHLYRKAG